MEPASKVIYLELYEVLIRELCWIFVMFDYVDYFLPDATEIIGRENTSDY